MKTINIFKTMAVVLLVSAFTACVQGDDFDVPVINQTEPDITVSSKFQDIVDIYTTVGGLVNFNDHGTELYIEGYVVSNDESGNFYKTISIQNDIDGLDDDPTNPRLGFRIDIDQTNLFAMYNVGRKVYVKLNGLYMNESNGVLTIGGYDSEDNDVGRISNFLVEEHIIRSTEVATITPKVTTIDAITDADLNTLIQLEGMQFDFLGTTYAGEPSDEFDGERNLLNCATNNTITLSTSTFADFKSHSVADNKGALTALLSKNYEGDTNVLLLRDTSDINFTENRCDPIFEENFESYGSGDTIDQNGWTNYMEAGTKDFHAYTDSYSIGRSARIGSYLSGDASTITWMISPGIDMDAQTGEVLSFQTSNSFSDGSNLEALISTDWDGTPGGVATATWSTLPATIVDDSDFYQDWISSGAVDLSGYSGTAHIAFKYTGSGSSSMDGTYEIDSIKIFAD